LTRGKKKQNRGCLLPDIEDEQKVSPGYQSGLEKGKVIKPKKSGTLEKKASRKEEHIENKNDFYGGASKPEELSGGNQQTNTPHQACPKKGKRNPPKSQPRDT